MFIKKIIAALLISVFCAGTVHAGLFSSGVPTSKVTEDAIAPFRAPGDKQKCLFAPYPGTFEVQVLNRYTRKFDNEDWQCVEVKVIFTGVDTITPQAVRVFCFEYAYIQRGNRWERKRISEINLCLDEWKYSKRKPSEILGEEIGALHETGLPSHPYTNDRETLYFSASNETWELSSEIVVKPPKEVLENAELHVGGVSINRQLGKGLEKPVARQTALLEDSARQGNAEAQLELGFRYQKGDGVKKDSYEAFKWFQKSAEQGNRDAQTALATAYAGGIGTSQDIDEAVKWFNRAIAQNQPQAQYALGVWYFKGNYVSKNLPKAIELFQKSASQEYAGSQFMLGCCYAYGIGIEKDASKAKALLKRAAKQGHIEAKKALLELGD